jgi:glycosyltransferase involved in cell wall biosynthesis
VNIHVDGMFFRVSGIGRVYENVLGALAASPEVSRITTIVPRAKEAEFREAFPQDKIEARYVGFPPLGFDDFFRKGSIIREFRPAPDFCFFPNFNVPLFLEGKIVSTVLDLIPISRYSDLPRIKRAGFRFLVGRSLRRSARVVCISEFTRDQVAENYGISPDRLHVIYPWVEEGFATDAVEIRMGARLVEGDYLLFVGNRFVHKNLGCLLDAFRTLLPEFPGLRLVIAGARMRPRDDVDAAVSDPALGGRIVQFTNASDVQIRNLYAFARAFVFPTFIEGFGIPPLEALAFGVPAICSDIPVIREVCGNSVEYADPGNPGSFRDAIRDVLLSVETHPSGEGRGFTGDRFRKEESLRSYMDLFRSVALERRSGRA